MFFFKTVNCPSQLLWCNMVAYIELSDTIFQLTLAEVISTSKGAVAVPFEYQFNEAIRA